ncbi:MAG TPA: hypothetical protein VMV56_12700 [Williamwhitmania sp.]|nr:hypothetical protein [Williamwhitmania sp.]
MKKLSNQTRNNIRNASLFILGAIVTIIVTKTSDKIIPNDPVIVKEFTDTIKIVHDYKIPNELNDDSTRFEIEKKIKNLELLNNYDKQIKERIALTKKEDGISPNLILTNKTSKLKSKGYTYGSSSSYFSSNCPSLDKDFLDINFNFFNTAILSEIAYLRVNIYRFDNNESKEARTSILEEFYEVKPSDNFIRISNDFAKGKYEIIYGFLFKDDLAKEYPAFYFKKCVVTK